MFVKITEQCRVYSKHYLSVYSMKWGWRGHSSLRSGPILHRLLTNQLAKGCKEP